MSFELLVAIGAILIGIDLMMLGTVYMIIVGLSVLQVSAITFFIPELAIVEQLFILFVGIIVNYFLLIKPLKSMMKTDKEVYSESTFTSGGFGVVKSTPSGWAVEYNGTSWLIQNAHDFQQGEISEGMRVFVRDIASNKAVIDIDHSDLTDSEVK